MTHFIGELERLLEQDGAKPFHRDHLLPEVDGAAHDEAAGHRVDEECRVSLGSSPRETHGTRRALVLNPIMHELPRAALAALCASTPRAARVGGGGAAARRHQRDRALSGNEAVRPVPFDDWARTPVGVRLGAAGVGCKLRRQPPGRRRRAQQILAQHALHMEALKGVAHLRALVPRVDRLHAAYHCHAVAGTHGAVGKVDVLGEGHVGKPKLAPQRRPVRQAAPEDGGALWIDLVEAQLWQRDHKRQLQRRQLGVAPHNRRDLLPNARRLVEVVVVPVQNDVAKGSVDGRRALRADGGAPRQGDEPHGKAADAGSALTWRGGRGRRRLFAPIGLGNLEVWIRGAQERLQIGAAVVDHEHLERAVVLVGNLAQRKKHVLGSIAREDHDGGERLGHSDIAIGERRFSFNG